MGISTGELPASQCAVFNCNHRRNWKQYNASSVVISFHKFHVKSAPLKQMLHDWQVGFAWSRFNLLCLTHLTADRCSTDVYEQYSGHMSTRRGWRLLILFSHRPHAFISTQTTDCNICPGYMARRCYLSISTNKTDLSWERTTLECFNFARV